MIHPMITALTFGISNLFSPKSTTAPSGTRSRRTRDGSRATRASTINGMMQSYKDDDVKLRGYAGAKMARKAKAKTLGIKSGHA